MFFLVEKDLNVAGPPSKIGVRLSIGKASQQRTPFLHLAKRGAF
jgi:hypothetical protein